MDETLVKSNHYTIVIGDFNSQIGKKNIPYGRGNGHIWARKRRHLGRMGNIKNVQGHKYHVSKESREEMDVEKHKWSNEDRN